MVDLKTHTGAVFSDDENKTHRYALWRKWDFAKPNIMFIGLNPSRANEHFNDPTITRCIDFAKRFGYGGMYFANLFTFRTPYPNELAWAEVQVGEHADEWMKVMAADSFRIVFAWGQWRYPMIHRRAREVENLLPGSYCFGRTKKNFPKHPLYLPKESKLIPY